VLFHIFCHDRHRNATPEKPYQGTAHPVGFLLMEDIHCLSVPEPQKLGHHGIGKAILILGEGPCLRYLPNAAAMTDLVTQPGLGLGLGRRDLKAVHFAIELTASWSSIQKACPCHGADRRAVRRCPTVGAPMSGMSIAQSGLEFAPSPDLLERQSHKSGHLRIA
jgi:hypothetical protein